MNHRLRWPHGDIDLEPRIVPSNTPPVLVSDIQTGSGSANPSQTLAIGSQLYFAADDGLSGAELWTSDGTSTGTRLVFDINTAAQSGSNPAELTEVNGGFYFAATSKFDRELWFSDGTSAGTRLVRNIETFGSSYPSGLTNVSGKLLFYAQTNAGGREVWTSDGTSAGTTMVADISPGPFSAVFSEPGVNAGGVFYFPAEDAAGGINDGIELWRTDGTSTGTFLVRDIFVGGSGSNPQSLTELNGSVAFAANDGSNFEVWISDGTSTGTTKISSTTLGTGPGAPAPGGLTNVAGTLFFGAQSTAGIELFKTDGTSSATVLVRDIRPGGSSSFPSGLTNVGGKLFFDADDGTTGRELWISDGTSTGTQLVFEVNPGSTGFGTYEITDVDGVAYFAASKVDVSPELFRSDGTSAGTTLIDIDLNSQSNPNALTAVGSRLFFAAFRPDVGQELFTLVEDSIAPNITDINSPNPDGSYYTGQSVTITLTFSEPVTLSGGTVDVTLDTGVTLTILPFSGTTVDATYIVGSGEFSLDLDVLSLTLSSGAVFQDAVGNPADLTLPPMGLAILRDLMINLPQVAPTISDTPDQSVNAGTTVGPLSIIVSDLDSTSSPLTLSVSSNNPALIPTSAVAFGGSGGERSITVLTQPGLTGIATLKVTVTDPDGLTATDTITITQNGPPAITAIANQNVTAGNTVGPLTFDVGGNFTTPGALVLSVSSDNAAISPSAVTFGGSGSTRTITVPTTAGVATVTTLTVTVTDPTNGFTATTAFTITQTLPNTPPAIGDIPDQTVLAGTTIGPISFTLSDQETPPDMLAVSVSSDNPALIPNSAVTFAGSGATRTITVTTQAGISGTATLTVTVTDSGGLTAVDTIVVNQYLPPTISDIPNQTVTAGTIIGPLDFTIGSTTTTADLLQVSVTSNNAAIPAGAVSFGGSGPNRTITIATTAGLAATTTLTVTVTDPVTGSTSSDDIIIVQTPNTVPTISPIANATVIQGGTVGPVNFIVGDAESPADSLTVTATSSDPSLIPATAITLGGGGANRNLTIATTPGITGIATVTVTVTDPFGGTVIETLTVTITATATTVAAFAVGRGPEVSPGLLRVFNADLTERFSFMPFGPDYDCGIRTVLADFTGDGVEDIVAGTRYHADNGWDLITSSRVTVFDGVSLQPLFDIVPFGDAYTNGVNLSAGDMNGDGLAELAISADYGGGARIRVFSATAAGFVQRADFIALLDANGNADTRFRGGARTAIGDLDGDGFGDLFFAAGIGGGPRIAVFDGKALGLNGGPKLRGDFFAFEPSLRNGANIAVGDIDGDGKVELIAAPSSGGAPRITAFSGASLLQGPLVRIADFFAGGTDERSGVRLAIRDLDGDGLADIVAGAGPNISNNVFGYRASDLNASGTASPFFEFEAFPGNPVGVWVG